MPAPRKYDEETEAPWVRWRLGLLDSNQLAGGVLTVVGVLELGRRDVAEEAVQAGGVEPMDPAEGGQLDLVDVAPGSLPPDQLGLVEPVHRFGQRVVVRIADTTDR